MQVLESCPSCENGDLVDVDLSTNLTDTHKAIIGSNVIWEANYAYCPCCELMFARNRQDTEEIDDYYAAFPEVEKRSYTVYPLPQQFIDVQEKFSERLIGNVEKAGLIRPDMSVLNIRCEYGVHLAHLRDKFGVQDLYGLDHFETNMQYAREDLGLSNIGYLDPYHVHVPFERQSFDLVLANHLMTHALDPMALLAHLRSLVAPGGAIVFYNELDHMGLMDMRKMYRRGVISYHKQLLTRNSLQNMLKRAGYRFDFLDYDTTGIKWASGRHSMAIAACPDTPASVSELTAPAAENLYQAYLDGYDRHAPNKLLRTVKKALGMEQISA